MTVASETVDVKIACKYGWLDHTVTVWALSSSEALIEYAQHIVPEITPIVKWVPREMLYELNW